LQDQVEESKALLNRAELMEATVGVPYHMLQRILLPWSNVLHKFSFTSE